MSRLSPRVCSGLMYESVPWIVPTSLITVAPATSASVIRARPKSRIFAPASVTTMFEGFRSRWMTPR